LTSQEGVSRIASHERGSMREESGGWDRYFRLIKAIALKEVLPRRKPQIKLLDRTMYLKV